MKIDKEIIFFQKKKIEKNIVKYKTKIKEILKILNKTGLRIVYVVDKNYNFIGTINDGDIRRGFLKGFSLSNSCFSLVNKKSKFIRESHHYSNVSKTIDLNNIDHLPVINSQRKIIGTYLVLKKNTTSLNNNIPVVLMAGGKGERLMPLTKKIPKPMIRIDGKPIIEHIIEKLSHEGFKQFYISVNYLANKIQDYFGNGKNFGVKINYIKEKKYLGTAGSLYFLKNKIKKNFLLINADVITNINYQNLVKFHKINKSLITIAVSSYENTIPFGVVQFQGGKLKGFKEKPIFKHYVNAGVYSVEPSVLKHFKKPQNLSMPELFMRDKIKKRTIIYPIHEGWTDLGTKKNLIKAKKQMKRKK